MKLESKIYVAGHTGLVGSAIVEKLKEKGYNNMIFTPHSEYDLRNQQQVNDFFEKEKPEYVFLAAAKVGGIMANSTYPADFLYDNIMIEANVIHAAHKNKVKKLLFLGSSCIYPKDCPQPIKEEYLLTGPLEETNEAYAIAKITGLKLCQYYRKQYGDDFISAMPTNVFGPNDNYDLETSHVLAAMIRKLHLAKCLEENDFEAIRNDFRKRAVSHKNKYEETMSDCEIVEILSYYGIKKGPHSGVSLTLWGSGEPYREFLYSEDLAEMLIEMMHHYSEPMHLNVGTGKDIRISELAKMIKEIVGFKGGIYWDKSKPDGTKRKKLNMKMAINVVSKKNMPTEKDISDLYEKYQSADILNN